MYEWRKMTPEDRLEVMHFRSTHQRPWHSPPHVHSRETSLYLFTASCFNHAAIIGHSPDRMQGFEQRLLDTAEATCSKVFAWVVPPSAHQYLGKVGEDTARRIWRDYPIEEYGKGWDD